ncbi:MAG: hypothetical protein HRU70_13270 [Phycisphaeraceae bacterium]|nr:MAG: hypothetical protein HRU70_13270 [Phycisphaeraceae bacterium]
MVRKIAVVALVGVMGLAGVLGGCGLNPYSPGGAGASWDTFTYVSTAETPMTISVLDKRNGEVLLTVEVPVGEQLVVSFKEGVYIERGKPQPANPDLMRWDLMPAGRSFGVLGNEMPVPDKSARHVAMDLREPGEFPESRGPRAAGGAGGAGGAGRTSASAPTR